MKAARLDVYNHFGCQMYIDCYWTDQIKNEFQLDEVLTISHAKRMVMLNIGAIMQNAFGKWHPSISGSQSPYAIYVAFGGADNGVRCKRMAHKFILGEVDIASQLWPWHWSHTPLLHNTILPLQILSNAINCMVAHFYRRFISETSCISLNGHLLALTPYEFFVRMNCAQVLATDVKELMKCIEYHTIYMYSEYQFTETMEKNTQ